MRCFSSLGLLGNSGIKARLTAPPDFSQSSTPFRLLAPRHPPHALNSLATLLTPSPRVTTQRRSLPLSSYYSHSLGNEWERRLKLVRFLRLVLELSLIIANRPTVAHRPHRDATSCSPSCQRSTFRLRAFHPPPGRRLTPPPLSLRPNRPQVFSRLGLTHSSGLNSYCLIRLSSTIHRDFFRDRDNCLSRLWRRGDSNP